ncbi:MAG: DNA recombination protein RmuC, partial [Candidatus Nealsonbacteria bacterium]|nr:DNA recombination protein RmuC [Candidatus Nealsonbacteria bacterium]
MDNLMEQGIIGILIAIIVGLGVAIFLLLRKRPENRSEAITMLQQQLNHISQILDNKLSESTRAIQTQFGQSAKIIQDVTEKLTRLDETNKQVVGFADQLRNLQD